MKKNKIFILLLFAIISCSRKNECSKEVLIEKVSSEWLKLYGDDIKEMKPYVARRKSDSIWVIEGTLPDGFDGGVPYAEINSKTCKIISISHGK